MTGVSRAAGTVMAVGGWVSTNGGWVIGLDWQRAQLGTQSDAVIRGGIGLGGREGFREHGSHQRTVATV